MPLGRQRGRRSEALRWRLEAAVAVSSRHVRRLTRFGPGVGERSHMVGTVLYIAWTIMLHPSWPLFHTLCNLCAWECAFIACSAVGDTHRHKFWQDGFDDLVSI